MFLQIDDTRAQRKKDQNMLTTRVKIGNIEKTGDQALGRYWGLNQNANASFFGTTGKVRDQFRRTQAPTANIQFDDVGPVYLVVPAIFPFAKFITTNGISLVGGTVSSWTAEGGLVVTQNTAAARPMFISATGGMVNPTFNAKPTINFDNTGPEQSLVANAVAVAMAGLSTFGVEIVANAGTPSGAAYDIGNMTITPNNAGVATGRLGATLLSSSLLPSGSPTPRTILFTGDGATLYLYLDGVLASSFAQPGPTAGTTGKFGYEDGAGAGFTGKLAQVSLSKSVVTAAQAQASAAENRRRYVPAILRRDSPDGERMTDFQDFNDGPDHVAEEKKIRKEYHNVGPIPVPYTSGRYSFVIAKFLEVDERGGDIGTSPVAYKSSMAEDGDSMVVLASHALQTEQGVAYLLRKLRIEFCGGDLDEAVRVVDEAKRALGVDCEEYIGLLREVNDPARLLMAKQEERVKELTAASEAPKQIGTGRKSKSKSHKSDKAQHGQEKR